MASEALLSRDAARDGMLGGPGLQRHGASPDASRGAVSRLPWARVYNRSETSLQAHTGEGTPARGIRGSEHCPTLKFSSAMIAVGVAFLMKVFLGGGSLITKLRPSVPHIPRR